MLRKPAFIVACFNLTVLSFLLSISFNLNASPKANAWTYWLSADNSSITVVDYTAWSLFLVKHVKPSKEGNNLVDYASVASEDKKNLAAFINYMKNLNPLHMKKNEQFAYWVNIYNALTVQLILEKYPIKSITKLGGFFEFGPWDDKIVEINGKSLTLNDIEHRILRPGWKDKRIHYVVNCASLGCPNLLPIPLLASNIDKQLDEAAKAFINQEKGVEAKGSEVLLSKIYDWYAEDFGDKPMLFKHLSGYLNNKNTASILSSKNVIVKYQYDWTLNDYLSR